MSEDSWVRLAEQAMWPVVVLVLGLALRRQIGDFLGAIGGRITKVSALSVSVDLAVATESAPPWQGRGGDDIRGLVSAQMVNDSYFDSLRQALQLGAESDYFVVDLKREGTHAWLTTRLYLFTYVLSRLKGVRAVVFLATWDGVARRYVGTADPADLIRALEARAPHILAARLLVEARHISTPPDVPDVPAPAGPGAAAVPPPAAPPLLDMAAWWDRARREPYSAAPLGLAQEFVGRVQWQQPAGAVDPDPDAGWLRLPDQPGGSTTWEHAAWMSLGDLVDGSLSGAVRPEGFVIDDRSWSDEQRAAAVARVPEAFVALLTPAGRFDRLIDRQSLLHTLGEAAVR